MAFIFLRNFSGKSCERVNEIEKRAPTYLPGAFQPLDAAHIECAVDGHYTVKVVQLQQVLGDLDEASQHTDARLELQRRDNLRCYPVADLHRGTPRQLTREHEAYPVEPLGQLQQRVGWRLCLRTGRRLRLLGPRAAIHVLVAYRREQRVVQQRKLAGHLQRVDVVQHGCLAGLRANGQPRGGAQGRSLLPRRLSFLQEEH